MWWPGSSSAFASFALVAVVFAGCIGGNSPEVGAGDASYPIGVHPYPVPAQLDPSDPNVWPLDLVGPFELKELLELHVPSFDGTLLQTWVLLPDVPEGTKVPAVLKGSPYYGQNVHDFNGHTGDDPEYWDNSRAAEAVPVNLLVENGYAVVLAGVRGTGNSGGCFDFFGPDEQQDQAFMVEWIAQQPWSNGRVGMMGLSYHGTTPLEAAILNPPSLKTIVVSGIVSDLFDFLIQSPQGAGWAVGGPFGVAYTHWQSLSPPVTAPTKGDAMYGVESWVANGNAMERACPETVDLFNAWATSYQRPDRDEQLALERRLIDRFPDISASVLITHGALDGDGPFAHNNADRDFWVNTPEAPKHWIKGQWGHRFPNYNGLDSGSIVEDWNDRLVGWLDFWLKGIGAPPEALGTVEYEDTSGAWHNTTHWPPAEVRHEVLYLSGGNALATTPGDGTASFIAAPGSPELCYLGDPVAERTLVAGNPLAHLRLHSDRPGGQFAVGLVAVPEGGSCADGETWNWGAADLLFHAGNFDAEPFPVGTPTNMRVDIVDQAFVLEPGQRLGVRFWYWEQFAGVPQFPQLTVHHDGGPEASHIVVPVAEGTLGGAPPTLEYPPRPHVPIQYAYT